MPEAELEIRPRMVGDASDQLADTRRALRRLEDEQEDALRSGRGDVDRLEDKYEALERQMHDTQDRAGGFNRMLGGIAATAASFAAFEGGRTLLDLTVGAAGDMQRRRQMMGEIFDDTHAAMERSRRLTREIASMSLGDAVKGMQTLGTKAEGSAEQAGELVKLGKALQTLNPQQGFEGAVLAIKELTSGSARSVVDRFNLARSAFPDRDEAKSIAKEQGKTLQQVYLGRLRDQLQKRGGVERLLEVDRQSLRGQMQMLETAGRDLLRTVGEHALPEVTSSVSEVADELRALGEDEEFQQAAEEFGTWMGDSAESVADMAPTLIREIPDAVQAVENTFTTIADFYDNHPTLVKIAAGALGVNAATGGAAGQFLGRAGGDLVGGLLGGRGGAGAGSVVEAVAGRGKCCEGIDEMAGTLDDAVSRGAGGASRSFLQRTLFSGGSSAAAASFTEATMAAITPSAIGSIAAAAAPFALGAIGLSDFASKRDPTETKSNAFSSQSEVTNAIMKDLVKGRSGKAKRKIIAASGGDPNETFTGTDVQRQLFEQVKARLETFGLQATLKKGQKFKDIQFRQAGGVGHELGTFGGLGDTELSDVSDISGKQAVQQLNQTKVEVNVPAGTKNPEQFGRRVGKAAKKELDKEARKRKSKE